MQTTLFKNGGSQAMRVPAEFRFSGETVDVEWSDELGALLVRPSNRDRMAAFFEHLEDEPVSSDAPDFYPVDAAGSFDVVAYFAQD